MRLSRTVYGYERLERDDEVVKSSLKYFSNKYPKYGFWQIFKRIKRDGMSWNHKRVYRVYKELGLNLRKKSKKRLPARVKVPLVKPQLTNDTWSIDFMSDNLISGKHFRLLNV